MENAVKRALETWCQAKKAELHPRINRLIALANWDLYHGPTMDGQDDDEDADDGSKVVYPGFVNACREITAALDGIVQDVWVDIQTENVQTTEPQGYQDGEEWVEPDWEDYRLVDARQVKYALLGRELAGHC